MPVSPIGLPVNLYPVVTAGTRRLHTLSPGRPIRGFSRLSNWLGRMLPPFEGVIQLPDGLRVAIDTRLPAERQMMVSGLLQPALAEFLKQHTAPGAHCLDLGANIGFFTLKLAHWAGPQGRVAAFEANPGMAARVRRNIALNHDLRVEVVERPVDRQTGPITFLVAADAGKSSVLADHVRAPVEILTIDAITLDDYLRAKAWDRLDVIKSDIEGNDCNALLGGQAVLTRFKPLIVLEYWYDTPPEIAGECFRFLEGLGYAFERLPSHGARLPFDWRHAGQHDPRAPKHVDVICTPPG